MFMPVLHSLLLSSLHVDPHLLQSTSSPSSNVQVHSENAIMPPVWTCTHVINDHSPLYNRPWELLHSEVSLGDPKANAGRRMPYVHLAQTAVLVPIPAYAHARTF